MTVLCYSFCRVFCFVQARYPLSFLMWGLHSNNDGHHLRTPQGLWDGDVLEFGLMARHGAVTLVDDETMSMLDLEASLAWVKGMSDGPK